MESAQSAPLGLGVTKGSGLGPLNLNRMEMPELGPGRLASWGRAEVPRRGLHCFEAKIEINGGHTRPGRRPLETGRGPVDMAMRSLARKVSAALATCRASCSWRLERLKWAALGRGLRERQGREGARLGIQLARPYADGHFPEFRPPRSSAELAALEGSPRRRKDSSARRRRLDGRTE